MIFVRRKSFKLLLLSCAAIAAPIASSQTNVLSGIGARLKQGHAIFQVGGHWSHQGKAQHVNIQTLIGDDFTVTNHDSSNGLVGLGYFLDGQAKSIFNMSYGLNAFYLAKTGVAGNVVQEGLFTNLSYHYTLTHFPLYAIAKSTIQTQYPQYAINIDAGIGPNFMTAGGFQEQSLDGITIPDNIFSTHHSTAFTATAGFGVKVNQVFGPAPLECGYRFFYLGQGHFGSKSSQVVNNLETGNNFANAVVCSITV